MIRKTKIHNKKKVSFNLNVQFSLVVIVSTLLGYAAIFTVTHLVEPLLNSYIMPWVDQMNTELEVINQELIQWSDNKEIIIRNEESIPEIDEFLKKHPEYTFKYKGFLNTTVEKLQMSTKGAKLRTSSYAATYVQVKNGVIVIGVIPDIAKWAALGIFSIIILYVLVQLSIIGLYASRKARYLKTMAANLEVMAGGDLDIRVPVKGRDEMAQVAWHINEMTKALKERIQKEREVEDTKKQLITNISHDLRTPLTAVMGYLSLLEEMEPEKDGNKMKDYIHTVHHKSEDISHLVDQLFDYVLLSNHQTEFRYQAMEPSLLWHQLFTNSENILVSKNIQVNYQLLPHHKILTDVNQLKRVVDNVMQNIEKYGLKDSIVEIKGSGSEDQYILIISNASEEHLDQYGEDFLNRYFTTDRISGKSAGLGLAICKEIIEQHGGNLKIKTDEKAFQMIIILPNIKEVDVQ